MGGFGQQGPFGRQSAQNLHCSDDRVVVGECCPREGQEKTTGQRAWVGGGSPTQASEEAFCTNHGRKAQGRGEEWGSGGVVGQRITFRTVFYIFPGTERSWDNRDENKNPGRLMRSKKLTFKFA